MWTPLVAAYCMQHEASKDGTTDMPPSKLYKHPAKSPIRREPPKLLMALLKRLP